VGRVSYGKRLGQNKEGRSVKYVASFTEPIDAYRIADEIERWFGFSISVVIGNSLYVDTRFPTWERAYQYGRDLYLSR
jgi:hypothetical protein